MGFRFLLSSCLLLVLGACGEQSPQPAAPDTPAAQTVAPDGEALPDLGGREITVAVENAYLPFNYILSDTGESAGWDYDAWREICGLLNCRPRFVEVPWENILDTVAAGEYDTAGNGITVTEERRDRVDFSVPYLAIVQHLLVRNDETRFSSVDEFERNDALMIGAQPGTTNYETAVALVGEGRVLPYERFSQAVDALFEGVVDAVVMDQVAGQGYVGPKADRLRFLPEPLSRDSLAFIFPPASDLRQPVNKSLAMLASRGTLDELADKYFSQEFGVTYDEIDFPEYQ